MMRIFTLLGALLLSGVALTAQESDKTQPIRCTSTDNVPTNYMTNMDYKRSYRADIELGASLKRKFDITTSHGYSYGNGLYVGGGIGFGAEFNPDIKAKPIYIVPMFADIKYSFINSIVTPFVSMKGGAVADISNSGIRTFANPAFGVGIARFSIKVGYEYQLGFWGTGNGKHQHAVKFGFGYTF